MTRKYVTISFISALGAFGLIHLVFSLIGSYGYLMGIRRPAFEEGPLSSSFSS